MKCNKCKKEFNMLSSWIGMGNTWSLYVCPHCNWKHYTGWLFPCESIWQDAKDGKASIDFGPHHKYIWGSGPVAGKLGKIYCKGCKWLETSLNMPMGQAPVACCVHSSNIKREQIESALWYTETYRTIRIQKVDEKNKNNDCKYRKREKGKQDGN